jgi:NADPH-dependent 2,4-dienoyl-CoA reductase/sulfur reductase-like enzyme/ferredoxin
MAPEPVDVDVAITLRRERPAFPNYTQLPIRVPIGAWQVARAGTLAAGVALCVVLVLQPDTGLKLFWGLLVPALPIIWVVLPGLWRNLCPLATSNQVPRVLGFTRALKPPAVMSRFAYVFGIAAFFVLVPARKALFNRSGTATAVLLLVVLGLAFAGGLFFQGKSGWCSTVCPLLPVQRLYGETPFLLVRNSHCEPCVGCAKNCYDFNPKAAKLADLHDDDAQYAAPRRFFAAAFPGLIVGFFSMPNVPAQSIAWIYGRIALFVAASVAVFSFGETFVSVSAHKLTAVFAAAAFNAFYWYSVPILVDTVGGSPEGDVRNVGVWAGRSVVFAITIPWLVRTFAKERQFLAANLAAPVVAPAGLGALRSRTAGSPTVTFQPDGPDVAVVVGTPLLDVIEGAGLAIEAGCRMGTCGADPIAILDGAECLSPVHSDEASTLGRLGLAANTRLACQARVHGACVVSLAPEPAQVRWAPPAPPSAADPTVRRLVILGHGIAGATAADHARRLHPDCQIHLVGAEPHRLYNRMAISRLIYGRSAMQGLYLLPDAWYDDNGVTCWLNTRARAVDVESRTVALATGETLSYDRLIIATGSRSVVPPVPGIHLPGSFTLRLAEDAIAMRAYAQEQDVHAAVVAGGGPLGLESAYALRKLGLETTVLERGPWLLSRHLDEAAARVVERYFDALGITVVTDATAQAVTGVARVEGVFLTDGRELDCRLFLACPGVVPNVELARDAGLLTARGVVVDARMRTSDPFVYAAGDVAEFGGELVGLWPQSARQGEVAAANAVGVDAAYAAKPATTLLKVVGLDVASIGRCHTTPADVVIALADDQAARYRKLIIDEGRLVGAILVGYPRDIPAVQSAIEDARHVSAVLDELYAGQWSVLESVPAASATKVQPA